jgi:hypothetical protein
MRIKEIKRCQTALNSGVPCSPDNRTDDHDTQDDEDGLCLPCRGESPPDSD